MVAESIKSLLSTGLNNNPFLSDQIDGAASREHNSFHAHSSLDGPARNIEAFVGNSLAGYKPWDGWTEDTHRLALRICSLGAFMVLGSTCLGPYSQGLLRMEFVLASSYFIAYFLFAFSRESQLFLKAMVLRFFCLSNIGAFELTQALGSLFTPKFSTLWFPLWAKHL